MQALIDFSERVDIIRSEVMQSGSQPRHYTSQREHSSARREQCHQLNFGVYVSRNDHTTSMHQPVSELNFLKQRFESTIKTAIESYKFDD